MTDTNAADISADEFDRESEAHSRVTGVFKTAFNVLEQEKSGLEEAARERLQAYVDGRFLGKKKGSGGRPAGSGSKDGQATGTRSKSRA